jgi:hypothetical protein
VIAMGTEGFKDILFIDDADDGNANVASLEDEQSSDMNDENSYDEKFIADYFSEGKEFVELEKSFYRACKKIIESSDKYNLVVFDLNLKKGIRKNDAENKELYRLFKERNIKFKRNEKNSKGLTKNKKNEEDVKIEEIVETAGIYLYMLLQSQGYPAERMIILTGNKTEGLEDGFQYFDLGNIIKEKNYKINLDEEYYKYKADETNSSNSYYRIRRLVLHACCYWEKHLKSMEDSDITFNKLYFSKGEKISKDSFVQMLERIKMLFPVTKPAEPEKVYYQAMQVAAMYHEESAKHYKISDECEYKKYHSCIRNFRNWSAHNKLEDKELKAEQFALLLCIALRTYFDEEISDDKKNKNEKYSFSDKLFCYETSYGFKKSEEQFAHDKLAKMKDWLWEIWRATTEETDRDDKNDKNDAPVKNIDTQIRNYGQKNVKMKTCHIFMPIWSYNRNVDKKREETSSVITYTYKLESSDMQPVGSIDSVFMSYCYEWIEPSR